jgi:hypothetical protein
MKKSVFTVSLIVLSFFLQTCREDETLSKGNVQFVFDVAASDNTGGRSLSELPDGSTLSILTTTGTYFSEISILKFGDQYISAPIPFVQGDHELLEFYIRSGNAVLYACPYEDSPLAPLVEDPLPVTFSVTENEITNFNIQVVSTQARHPYEFGYASFGIKVVPGELFKLAIFGPSENETQVYTGAQAYVLHDDDTLFDKYLDPKINSIFFESNPDDYYTLVLIEPSLKKYSKTFRVNELQEELNGTPLSVNMDPALTFTIATAYTGNILEFEINSSNPTLKGEVQIDWGDGTLEDVLLPKTTEYFLDHVYSTDGPHFVSVSGDLDVIEHFFNAYSPIDNLSVKYLSALKELTVVTTLTLETVDISHNKKLESVSFSMGRLTSLDVSHNPKLKSISLDFNTTFTTAAVDNVIHEALQNAIDHNLHNGGINLASDFGESSPLIGPPSPSALDELRTLRDTYGWYIYPENF